MKPTPSQARRYYLFSGLALAPATAANLFFLLRGLPPAAEMLPRSPHPGAYFVFLAVLAPLFLAGAHYAGYRLTLLKGASSPVPVPFLESAGTLLLPFIGAVSLLGVPPQFLLYIQGSLYLLIMLVRLAALLMLAFPVLTGSGEEGLSGGRLLLVLAGVPLVIYLGLFFLLGTTSSTTGDEPYYLMVAESISRDLDLDLANQFQEKSFTEYYWKDRLAPQNMFTTPGGKVYSTAYTTLFTLILAPVSLADPRWGPTLLVIIISALLSAALFTLALEVTGSRRAAFTAWAFSSFTLPLLAFSSQIYPETAAALAGALLFREVLSRTDDRRRGRRSLAIIIICAVILPALKIRYLPVSLAGLAVMALRGKRRSRVLPAFAALGAALLVIITLDHYLLEGAILLKRFSTPNLIFRLRKFLRFWPSSLTGLFADQEFGLLFHSPVYLLLTAGIFQAFRRRSAQQVSLLLPAAGYLILLIGHFGHWWYGGYSQPSRYLVAVLPFLVPFLALTWTEYRGNTLSVFSSAAAIWSAALAFPYFLVFAFRYNNADGVNNIFGALRDRLGLYMHHFYPSLMNPEAWKVSGYLTLAVLILLPSAALIIRKAFTAHRPSSPRPRGEILSGAAALLLGILLLSMWAPLHLPTGIIEAETMTQEGGLLYTGYGWGKARVFKDAGWVKSRIVTRGDHQRLTINAGARSDGTLPWLVVYLDGEEINRFLLRGGEGRYLKQDHHMMMSAPPGKHYLKIGILRPESDSPPAPVYLNRITISGIR